MSSEVPIFPSYASYWSAIVHQYTRSPVEEATPEIKPNSTAIATYTLTFLCSNTTVLALRFELYHIFGDLDDLLMPLGEMYLEAFSQAVTTIRNHPLLSHLKRLRIKYSHPTHSHPQYEIPLYSTPTGCFDYGKPMTDRIGELFSALGLLDELTLHGCDLRPYLAPFFGIPEFKYFPRLFPPVKEFIISDPQMEFGEQKCMDAIVELAKSQYGSRKPLFCVKIRGRKLPRAVAESLKKWVDAVDCSE